MRIWINDTQLDTYDGSVSVTKTNNLWEFGKAEFVHTQTVKIPATNNNKALLDFADEFRTQSSVARGFVDCLVEIDGVFEDGRLYVSGYTDGEFSVIITFGKELLSLDVKLVDAIKDSAMPDHLRIGTSQDFVGAKIYDKDGAEVKKAAVKTNYLMSLLNASGMSVINYDVFNHTTLGIAFGVGADDVLMYERAITVPFNRAGGDVVSENPNTGDIAYTYNFGEFTDFANYAKVTKNAYMIYIFKNLKPPMGGAPYSYFYYGRIGYFQFPFDIELRFGSNANGYAVGFLDESKASTYEFIPVTKWQGHYINVEDFTVNGVASGTEVSNDLSGAKILIPKNQKFVINYYTDFAYEKELISGSFVTGYFTQGSVNDFTLQIPVSYGLFSKQFIPDVTVYQLLQIIAAYNNKMLYFNGSKYTLAAVSDITGESDYQCKDVEKGIAVSDKAFDFAQHNYVDYKSGGKSIDYTTNNVHLTEEKTLLTIPFDGGAVPTGKFRLADDFPAIGSILPVTYLMYALNVTKVSGLDEFLSSTRQVKIKFSMSYLDFTSVRELDNFEYKGATLQWSSLQWSDGWCTATLQTLQ